LCSWRYDVEGRGGKQVIGAKTATVEPGECPTDPEENIVEPKNEGAYCRNCGRFFEDLVELVGHEYQCKDYTAAPSENPFPENNAWHGLFKDYRTSFSYCNVCGQKLCSFGKENMRPELHDQYEPGVMHHCDVEKQRRIIGAGSIYRVVTGIMPEGTLKNLDPEDQPLIEKMRVKYAGVDNREKPAEPEPEKPKKQRKARKLPMKEFEAPSCIKTSIGPGGGVLYQQRSPEEVEAARSEGKEAWTKTIPKEQRLYSGPSAMTAKERASVRIEGYGKEALESRGLMADKAPAKAEKPKKPVEEEPASDRPYAKILQALREDLGLSLVQLRKRLKYDGDLELILSVMIQCGELKLVKQEGKGFVPRYFIDNTSLGDRILEQVKAGVDNYRDLAKALGKDKFSLKPAVRELIKAKRLRWRPNEMGKLEIPANKHPCEPCNICTSVDHKAECADEPCPDLGGPKCPCEDVRGCDDAAPMMLEAEQKEAEYRKQHIGPCKTCHHLETYPADKDGHPRGKCVNRKATGFGRVIRRIEQVRTEGCYEPQIGVEPVKAEPEKKAKRQKKAVKFPCIICGKPVVMGSDNPEKTGSGFCGPECLSSDNYVHDACEKKYGTQLAWKIARGEATAPTKEESTVQESTPEGGIVVKVPDKAGASRMEETPVCMEKPVLCMKPKSVLPPGQRTLDMYPTEA
jgi:hypothetical protein